MHVDLLRDTASTLPDWPSPKSITSLKVWHCGFRSLAPISALSNLQRLVIASYPDDTFQPLSELEFLEELEILHFPRVTSLTPLGSLPALRSLSLASLPSWDASSKRLQVESLSPLAALPRLEVLHLVGVVPPHKLLSELESSKSLKAARFHGYAKSELERFFAATGIAHASAA